jgi:hypothetical protein
MDHWIFVRKNQIVRLIKVLLQYNAVNILILQFQQCRIALDFVVGNLIQSQLLFRVILLNNVLIKLKDVKYYLQLQCYLFV